MRKEDVVLREDLIGLCEEFKKNGRFDLVCAVELMIKYCMRVGFFENLSVDKPMEQLTEMKVPFCYILMDSAYDAKTIDEFIRSRGRIPIIDPNERKDNDRPPLDPA
ncbi:MAG: hypothetical protein LBP80_07645, partial [Treponema sp.]|nr:hypothetical protein [Treponema sp.]